jgi:hypothetical protein
MDVSAVAGNRVKEAIPSQAMALIFKGGREQ